jgi:hypothetical protein
MMRNNGLALQIEGEAECSDRQFNLENEVAIQDDEPILVLIPLPTSIHLG